MKQIRNDTFELIQITSYMLSAIIFALGIMYDYDFVADQITYEDFWLGICIIRPLAYFVTFEAMAKLIIVAMCFICFIFKRSPRKEKIFDSAE